MAECGRRDGRSMLRAVVLGYDVCARAMFALGPLAFRAAGRSSHSVGPLFGAAAAAGALAGLKAKQVPYLLSYTAQQASGVNCWARTGPSKSVRFLRHAGAQRRYGGNQRRPDSGVDDVFSGDKNFIFLRGETDPEASRGLSVLVVNTSIKR
jgi:2-methylcitrate dehydratase PrpD